MDNKQTLKWFLVLILCTAYIFSFSHLGVLAYDSIMNKGNTFDEGTVIGGVNVSGKTVSEATRAVDEQLTKWLNETNIYVHYKEKMNTFDVRYIHFDIEKTVNSAHEGVQNKLIVETDGLEPFLIELSPSISSTEYNLESVKNEIFNIASSLQIGQFELKLEDFILNSETHNDHVINEVTLDLTSDSFDGNMIGKIKEFEVKPMSHFSLLSQIDELGVESLPIEILNSIASGIYEVILPTNFSIIERHISESLPEYAKLGYEAKVNPKRRMDFIFSNENDSNYKLQFEQSNSNLVITLKGPSFINQYEIIKKDRETFKPKTIVQFNPQLTPIEKIVKTVGEEGILVRVFRKTYDENGSLLRDEQISEDFYPPVHQVEVRGLIIDEIVSDTDSGIGESNNMTDNQVDQSTNINDADNTNNQEESFFQTTKDKNNVAEDPLWGKPNETFK